MKSNPQPASHGMLWFSVSGFMDFAALYFIHIAIAKTLGSISYALFGIFMALVLWFRFFMSGGIIATISRFLTHTGYDKKDVMRKGLVMQLSAGVLFSLLLWLSSGPVASYAREPELAFYLRLYVPHTFLYSVMVYLLTLRQSFRLYREYALLTGTYALLRTAGVGCLLVTGISLKGICLADLAAVFLTVAFFSLSSKKFIGLAGAKTGSLTINYPSFLHHSGYLLAFWACLTLVPVVNLLLAKRYIPDTAMIGFYVGALTVSKIPNLIVARSLYTLSLPIASEAISGGKNELAAHYIRQTWKLFLIVFAGFGVFLAVAGKELLQFIYTKNFAVIGPAMNLYYWGLATACAIHLSARFLYASGKFKIPFYISAGFLMVHTALGLLLIQPFGVTGAALAYGISGIAGFAVTLALPRQGLPAFASKLTTLKILAANLIFGLILVVVPGGGLVLIPRCALGGIAYLAALWGFKALTPEDFKSFFRSKGAVTSL